MTDRLTYDAVGATVPSQETWPATPAAYRRLESTTRTGRGEDHWRWAAREVLTWGIKTRSGFEVGTSDGGAVRAGEDHVVTARLGPLRVHEPVRVVAVVDEPDRVGFAYGTRTGHPVSGEEAFVLHRDADGTVWLTLRSLTRPGRGRWWPAFPELLVAQRVCLGRYRRALVGPGG